MSEKRVKITKLSLHECHAISSSSMNGGIAHPHVDRGLGIPLSSSGFSMGTNWHGMPRDQLLESPHLQLVASCSGPPFQTMRALHWQPHSLTVVFLTFLFLNNPNIHLNLKPPTLNLLREMEQYGCNLTPLLLLLLRFLLNMRHIVTCSTKLHVALS